MRRRLLKSSARWLGGLWFLSLGLTAGLAGQSRLDSIRTQLESGGLGAKSALFALREYCDKSPACQEDQINWLRGVNDTLSYLFQGDVSFEYLEDGDIAQALAHQHRGLQAATTAGNQFHRAHFLHAIGYIYTHATSQTDSAAHYLFLAIKAFGEKYRLEQWRSYYSLSHVFKYLGQKERSIEAMEKAYTLSREKGARMDYGFVLFHLLQFAFSLGQDTYITRYWPDYLEMRQTAGKLDAKHDALLEYLRGDDLAMDQLQGYLDRVENGEEPADPVNLGFFYGNLAEGYAQRDRVEEAVMAIRKAIHYDKAVKRKGNIVWLYETLADFGERLDDPEIILEGMRGYQAVKDSLAQAEYQASISRLEVEFETQKTEAELARSELALSETRRQRNQLQLGGAVLLLLLVGGFVFYRNRLNIQALRAAVAREEQQRELETVRRQAELSNLRALIEGQETERARVAKDLHDGLGGLLTTVKAHVANLSGTEAATSLIDRACTSVRRIAHNMVPQSLAESGMAASFNDLAAQLRVQGFEVDLEVIGDVDRAFGLSEQAVLLRIVQELTHNIVKHAEASSIMLQLFEQPERLLLLVEDDGKGFNLDYARRQGGGLGLGSVEQRVAYLEGSLQFDSRPGVGTTVSIELPLSQRE